LKIQKNRITTGTEKGASPQLLEIAQTAAKMMGALSLQRIKWYLSAKLDIPGGLDVNHKTDITIG